MKGLGNRPQMKFLLPLYNIVFILQGQQWVQTHTIINIFSELGLLAKHSAPRELGGSLGTLEAVVVLDC